MGFHEVRHVGPPFFDDGGFGQEIGGMVVGEFLHREEGKGLFVEKDGVVGDAGLGEFGREFGPDLLMASMVFLLVARFELHFKSDFVHFETKV